MNVADVRHASSATSDTQSVVCYSLHLASSGSERVLHYGFLSFFLFLSFDAEEHALQIFMSWRMPCGTRKLFSYTYIFLRHIQGWRL